MDLSVLTFNTASAEINHLSGVDELAPYIDGAKTIWININGFKDSDGIKKAGELFGLHPLTIEDILHTYQQPKIETFENYRYLSIKTIQRRETFGGTEKTEKKAFRFFAGRKKPEDNFPDGNYQFTIDQISIIIMENIVLTFQETPGGSFDGIRKKILHGTNDAGKMGTDYLAYTIIDAVVDEYFLALNCLEDEIETFEDHAAKTSGYKFIEDIQDTKKDLVRLKRAILPLKDNITAITRRDGFFQTDELKPFLQDLSEHLNHAIITVENYREWLSNIMDVNLSVLSYQTNKVMKVLAIISTIFIPLTFIAGVYGMNFEFMPELGYRFAYPIALGGMVIIAVIMFIFFKIRRWF